MSIIITNQPPQLRTENKNALRDPKTSPSLFSGEEEEVLDWLRTSGVKLRNIRGWK